MVRADDLARLRVKDEQGADVELGALWRDRTAVLVFVRHFGCIHCRAHAVGLQKDLAAIAAKGADVHVIGSGTPSFIAGFREETGWTGPIYSDASLAAYRAAELKRSVARTLDPRSLGKALAFLRDGHRQGRTQGDNWQQGGVLVVRPGGAVAWHHASDRPGDNATGAQILAAL
ncbi:MAG: AhpC/TSA family protein [Deltaproteobacteria bacterium]|nr:AhpC/TSA family protein [Deltaproteobacteria bacterium]MCW5804244.1 AhpC/TSA family protein [Deltaproteobacteria bacterium]